MRKIIVNSDILGLEINNRQIPLKFSIDVMREMGIDTLDEAAEKLKAAKELFTVTLCILNAAVKRYNRDYNGTELPITYSELTDVLPGLEYIQLLERNVTALYFCGLPKKKNTMNVWQDEEEGRSIEPTAGRLTVLGLTALHLTYAEVSGMTVGEVSALLDDYGYINSTGKKDKYAGKTIEGVGDADALMGIKKA